MTSTDAQRLNVNINDETAGTLRRRKQTGTSHTETVHRAVALLDLLERESAQGAEILIKSPDGKTVREIHLV
jgi:hypothetical protein